MTEYTRINPNDLNEIPLARCMAEFEKRWPHNGHTEMIEQQIGWREGQPPEEAAQRWANLETTVYHTVRFVRWLEQ